MSAQPRVHRGSRRLARPLVHMAAWIAALCLVCSLARSARAAGQYTADAIKAAYLYRFAGYVTWPGPQPRGAPFTIAVIGDGAVGSELERLLPTHPINGHPARVHLIRRLSELGDARMLYVGDSYRGDLHAALASIATRPVLVVTDEQRGLDDGGTINFVEIGERVRFEVSLTAAGRAGLKISSELLSVAARVQGGHLRSRTSCAQGESSWDFGCPVRVAMQRSARHAERR